MTILGGAYLSPVTFFSDTYRNGDFRDPKFWERERSSWGDVFHEFEHESKVSLPAGRGSQAVKITNRSPLSISVDGLIATEVPEEAQTNEQAVVGIAAHLNSFLGLLCMGGLHPLPFSEKEICVVGELYGPLTQLSTGGDEYSTTTSGRTELRRVTPIHPITGEVDFNWVFLKIIDRARLQESYDLGRRLWEGLNRDTSLPILALTARGRYTHHLWNEALLLGWSVLESLVGKYWRKEVISPEADASRRKRLEDTRTFAASVRVESLYIAGRIDRGLYDGLNAMRKARNDLAHSGELATQSTVRELFGHVNSLLSLLTGHEAQFQDPGRTRTGRFI